MSVAILSRLFVTERWRQKGSASSVGLRIPALGDRDVGPEVEPLMATNARGRFVPTRRGATGLARYGFFPCPIEEEGQVLAALFEDAWSCSEKAQWGNRCATIASAIQQLRSRSLEPQVLVVPSDLLQVACGEERELDVAKEAMGARGYVTVVEGVQVLLADIPKGSAMVMTGPPFMGYYSRVGDYLGLMLIHVPQSLMLVRDGLAG